MCVAPSPGFNCMIKSGIFLSAHMGFHRWDVSGMRNLKEERIWLKLSSKPPPDTNILASILGESLVCTM